MKEKEKKVVRERKERQLKSRILQDIRNINAKHRLDYGRVALMSINELLWKKHTLQENERQLKATRRLQRWWREKLNNKKRGYRAIGIWEIKKMFDKITIIQKWWQKLKAKWAERNRFAKQSVAIVKI